MDRDKQPGQPHNPASSADQVSGNSDVEEFFRKLKSDMRRPKPGEDAIAAALQAIQRLAHDVDPTQIAEDSATPADAAPVGTCLICGNQNREENVFCGKCGAPLVKAVPDSEAEKAGPVPAVPPASPGAGQHHYHHHYHHHYFPAGLEAQSQFVPSSARVVNPASPAREALRTRAPLTGPALSRAESTVRRLTQEWALACNTKQLDDLVDFYAADAMVLRPNVPAVRGAASIREFFCSALDAGLGEVELEPLRVELFGDMAYEVGRCKMLVPVAVGKRREERGKYLIIFGRQPDGEWRALADCWSSDISLQTSAEAEPAKSGSIVPTGGILSRTPRKSA